MKKLTQEQERVIKEIFPELFKKELPNIGFFKCKHDEGVIYSKNLREGIGYGISGTGEYYTSGWNKGVFRSYEVRTKKTWVCGWG